MGKLPDDWRKANVVPMLKKREERSGRYSSH